MSEEETRKIHRGQTDTQEPEGLAGRQATSSVPWTSLPHSLLRQPFCSRAGHSLLRRQYQVTVSTCMGTLTAKIPPPQTDTYDCTHRSLDIQRACPRCSCVALAFWGCRLWASDFLSHLFTDFLDSFHISSARFGKRQTNQILFSPAHACVRPHESIPPLHLLGLEHRICQEQCSGKPC